MKILIVEDDFTSRKLMQSILRPLGDCDIAANGLEAVNAFKEAFESDGKYDLICLDMQMPELTGLDVIKQLREFEESKDVAGLAGVKIIVTSGVTDNKTILGGFKAGCEAYLLKPIDRRKLFEKIGELGLTEAESSKT